MRKNIPVPDGFIERVGIHSGVIKHKQKGVEYGVIFTANGSQKDYESGKFKRPTTSDFNKHELMGASMENVDAAQQNEPDRFFKILGGYFWDDETDTTKEVFGIALEADFGITEGGTVTLDNTCTLLDPDKPVLDERNEGTGWTFIVEPKEREKFPQSHRPIKIYVDCPVIENIDITYGDCNAQNQRKVTFVPSVSGGAVQSYTWEFGDGNRDSGNGPPQAVDHYFAQKPAKTVKLTITGNPACEATSREKALDGFTPCEKLVVCPELIGIEHVLTEENETTQKVDFTAVFEKGTPDEVEWDFGDGTSPVRSEKHTISHKYSRLRGGMLNFTVKVNSKGPGECRASHEKNIGVPGISVAGLCAYWPFIIAFLSALTVGTCTVQWCVSACGELFDLAPAPWLLPLLLILAVITALAIFMWYRQCDPGKCDWMAIAWVTVLSVMLVLFYINPCCSTLIMAILSLIAGGVVLALWVVKCKPAVISLLVFIVICVVTAAISSYVIAASALAGCL